MYYCVAVFCGIGPSGRVPGKRYAFGDCISVGHKVLLTAYLFAGTLLDYTVRDESAQLKYLGSTLGGKEGGV